MQTQAETALKALAEPNRLAILTLIRRRELPATEIAGHFKTTRPAVSQHLHVLTRAGLLYERREGTKRLYRLRPEGLRELRKLLDLFWDVKLDRLKAEVELEARNRRDR
jgi:DNA-binding transcriptional ArsR family regulator